MGWVSAAKNPANLQDCKLRAQPNSFAPNAKLREAAKGFTLEFAWDTVSDKAIMIGNNGVEEGTVILRRYNFASHNSMAAMNALSR